MALSVAGALAWLKKINDNIVALNANLLVLVEEQRRTNALLEAIGGAKRAVASPMEPWPPGTEWTRPAGQGAVHTGQHARFIHKGQLLIGRVASVGDAGVSVTVLSPPARGVYALDYGKFEVAS